MVSYINRGKRVRYVGNSADNKPVGVQNGAWYYEMDSGLKYMYDAENNVWHLQKDIGGESSGGGGTLDHTQLGNKDKPDQHPITAITGLVEALVKAGTNNRFVCSTSAESQVKIIKLNEDQVAPVNGSLTIIEFTNGNTAKNFNVEIQDPSGKVLRDYIGVRNPARYSDLYPKDGKPIVGEIPIKYECAVYFHETFAQWLNPPCVRPLVIDFEQFGFDLQRILAGNQSIVKFKDGYVELANEIKDKIAQSGGVFMHINEVNIWLKLGDLVDRGEDYSLSAYDGTSCYRFVCDYKRQRIMAEKIEVARATPEHTNMVVTAMKEGQTYKADKGASSIKYHYDNFGHVELRYFDESTNEDQVYNYETYDETNDVAIFRRMYPTEDGIERINVTVDYDGNIEVNRNGFNGKSLGIVDAEVGQSIEIEEIDNAGRPTKWKAIPSVKMDDANMSNRTVMSSIEMANRLAPRKSKTGAIVEMMPVEGYPFDIIAKIHAEQIGSEAPSITNIRPISGWDEILITLDNTITQQEYRQNFGEPVYGGTYEPNKGSLNITMASRTFNGTEDWKSIDVPNGRTPIFKLSVPGLGANSNVMNQLCNIFKTGPLTTPAFDSDCVWAIADEIYVGNGIAVQFNKNVNDFKAQLAKTNMQIVYELQTPIKKVVEQKRILAIEGKNVLQASTGDITITAPVAGIDEEDINNSIFNFLQSDIGKELVKGIVNEQV